MATKNIFIAASGTGGHLFPAAYIAEALREQRPDWTLIGIGSGRPLEEKIFSKYKVPLETIQTVGIKNRGIKGILQFATSLPKALLQTARLIQKYRPVLIIGVGGYVTVLPVLTGWLLGIPTWIHEAELKPGLANFFLSFFANKTSTAFEHSKLPFYANTEFTGHPVRRGLERAILREPADKQPTNILVLGGSQGARGLDEGMPMLSPFLKQHSLRVIHQCRAPSVDEVQRRYREQGFSAVEVVPFIDDMAAAYEWADILVSRSGAGSVMEIGVVNRPVIFVPSPHSQGDHQTKNAHTLVEKGKALLVQEHEIAGSESFPVRLQKAIATLLDRSSYNAMVTRGQSSRNVDAAQRIAGRALSLIDLR